MIVGPRSGLSVTQTMVVSAWNRNARDESRHRILSHDVTAGQGQVSL